MPQKQLHITPKKNIVLQFYICYHKNFTTWKLTKTSGPKRGTGPQQSVGLRDLIYPISIMHKIFMEDSGNLTHPKNVINNIMGSNLVNFCKLQLQKM